MTYTFRPKAHRDVTRRPAASEFTPTKLGPANADGMVGATAYFSWRQYGHHRQTEQKMTAGWLACPTLQQKLGKNDIK